MGRGELAPGCERWWLNASAERGPLVQCTWFRVFRSYEIMTEIFLHVNKCKEPNVDQNLLYHGKKRHGHYWEWDAAVSLMESEEHFGVSSLIHSSLWMNHRTSLHISPAGPQVDSELVQPLSFQPDLKLRDFEASAGSAVADHCRFMWLCSVVIGKWACQDLTSTAT